jgi:oxygen-dependent protoporphyrinogen oxidase
MQIRDAAGVAGSTRAGRRTLGRGSRRSSTRPERSMRVRSEPQAVVLGAGLAGLAAAESLQAAGWGVKLVEASGRPGGILSTVREDGWLVERSADSFLATRPEAIGLVDRLGLRDAVVGIAPAMRRALVWHQGRAVPAPAGFRLLAPGRLSGILRTPLLSPLGKLRVLAERWIPPRAPATSADDESLEAFATRRLGRQAFERLVQPLAAGIWTADPARLGMAAACPEFFAMERDAGSLWAGERARLRRPVEAAAAGARYGQFLTLADGMETLPTRLAARLREAGADMLTGRGTCVAPRGDGWTVHVDQVDGSEVALQADAVVLAVPALVAGRIVAALDGALSGELLGIEYAGSAIVSLGFERSAVDHPLDAAGMVVPRATGRRALAISFSSSKFPGRAPEGCVLMRVFVGGALDPAAVELADDTLVALALAEAATLVGARGTPRLVRVDRWHGAMPQYHVGHLARIGRIDDHLNRHRGLALAGSAYTGVGIPQVIGSGQEAARRVMADRSGLAGPANR